MTTDANLDQELHRTVKLALDSGEAATIAEAERIFSAYRVAVAVGSDVVSTSPGQAAVLTMVNAAARCFLGGVDVSVPRQQRLLVPVPGADDLDEAIRKLGGTIGQPASEHDPIIVVGEAVVPPSRSVVLRATFGGWSAGVVPVSSGVRLEEHSAITPAGVLAGAIAISEVFQHVRGNAVAGRREVGLSLWCPDPSKDWKIGDGPSLTLLPAELWLVGLGHLGQAFLWTLSLLPYTDRRNVDIVLQDFDVLSVANLSTSPLTFRDSVGTRKTRAMAQWLEDVGFRTALYERRFDASLRVGPKEPPIGVCGVDNLAARACLEDVGFSRIVEAGLGAGISEFLTLQIHTLPGPKGARDRWQASPPKSWGELLSKPAYDDLLQSGALDECGVTMLAGQTVGAPFVGLVAATLMLGELLRGILGERPSAVIDMDLRAVTCREVVENEVIQGSYPGAVVAAYRRDDE